MLDILIYLQLIPLLFITLLLGLTYPFINLRPKESWIRSLFKYTGILALIINFVLFWVGGPSFKISFLHLSFNPQNGIIYFVAVVILGIVNKFSIQYIHKEIGFHKFFLNISIFWLGLFLFIFSSSPLIIFSGWELIGISSIFLIAFYSYRKSPIKSSLYVLSFYKTADIILITSLLFLMHENNLSNYIYALIVIAGLIKSASFPFTSWLPRSMEGPTPSSGIYYAALSVNVGILLIYKFLPQIKSAPLASSILLYSSILTIIYSSFQSRVQSDIKSSLAYSASAQLGFVLLEFYLGYPNLGLFHLFASSFLKVYQFLRTPSLLHIYHSMEGEYGKTFSKTGTHFEFLLPKALRKRLYHWTLDHFYIDAFYSLVKKLLRSISGFSKFIFFPLVEGQKVVSYKSLMWLIYYIFIFYLITNGTFEISTLHFDIIPGILFFISLGMLFERRTSAFISFFALYKIVESFILYGVHSDEPYKWVGILIVGMFMLSIILYGKLKAKNSKAKYMVGPIVIFLMLYFTNFPFLLQSLVNEHIIESFINQENFLDLAIYCLANTFFTIGLYNFIFDHIYLSEALDG